MSLEAELDKLSDLLYAATEEGDTELILREAIDLLSNVRTRIKIVNMNRIVDL